MQAQTAEQVASAESNVVVVGGDVEGQLRRAMERRGVTVEAAPLDRIESSRPGRAVLVGWAAREGVATARRRLGDAVAIVAVLPEDAVGARLEALRHGARLVAPIDDAEALTDALLADKEATALGWTSLTGVMAAAGERARQALGARCGSVTLRIDDGAAAAALVDRFAGELAALAVEVRVDGSDAPVEDLGWDDDPQTMEQPEAELERWRRIAARGAVPPRRSVVLGTLKKKTPVPPSRRGPWAPTDSEPPPAEDHLPLLAAAAHVPAAPPTFQVEDDVDVTAPHDALPDLLAMAMPTAPAVPAPWGGPPSSGERPAVRPPAPEPVAPALGDAGDDEHHDVSPAGPDPAAPTEDRLTVPARPPRVDHAPRVAELPPPARAHDLSTPSRPSAPARPRLGLWIAIAAVLAIAGLLACGAALLALGGPALEPLVSEAVGPFRS